MPLKLDIINILVVLVALVNMIYGLVVYSRNRNDTTNFSFLTLTLAVSFWGVMMFFYRSSIDPVMATLFARLLYVAAATIPFAFLYFVFIFPQSTVHLKKWQKILPPLLFLVVTFISLYPGFLISGVTLYVYKEYFIHFNIGFHSFYAIYIIGTFLWAYILLTKKLLISKGIFRVQLAYILAGTIISTSIGLVTNLVMPYFGIFFLNWMGQVGVVVMISLISYSILKYRLFNVRVIAAELFVFALWVLFLIKSITASTLDDQLTNIAVLIVTIIFGILLIRSVTRQIEQSEKIESLAKRLDGLVHLISHEVKGALGKNRDTFAAILEGDLGEASEPMKKMVTAMDKSTKNTVEMVMDILNSSNAKNGKLLMVKSPFDMKAATEEVFAMLMPDAQERGIALKLEIPQGIDYTVNGDREKIVQHVIRNLVDNSIRYTPAGTITVSLLGGVKDNNVKDDKAKVLLIIKDTGVGITPEDMLHLFTEGGRGKDSVKVNVHSTGYGLFFAKTIVDAHGGRIWAESAGAGKGSQFYVELPAAEEGMDSILPS